MRLVQMKLLSNEGRTPIWAIKLAIEMRLSRALGL